MKSKDYGQLAAIDTKRATEVGALSFVALAQQFEGVYDDVTLIENSDMFPIWQPEWVGKVGTMVNDPADGQLYQKINADYNTPYPQSQPSKDKSQWKCIGDPTEEWPVWSQPQGAHDAYTMGMKCSHNGKNWICNVASTTYPPGVYGWEEAK